MAKWKSGRTGRVEESLCYQFREAELELPRESEVEQFDLVVSAPMGLILSAAGFQAERRILRGVADPAELLERSLTRLN